MIHVDAQDWRLFVAVASFVAFVHAYRKLSPFFAVTWFGSSLLFGWFWTTQHGSPEALLLPGLVTYVAAAVAKGIVERGALAGNHVVHVLATGVFAGLIAMPLEAAVNAMNWTTARGPILSLWPRANPVWTGGVPPELIIQWMVVGTLFYATYKLLDHVGLGPAMQTIVLFAAMPFLPKLMEAVLRLLG